MYGNCFKDLQQITLHQLKKGWDRRGLIATLTFKKYPNQEYQHPLIVNTMRVLTSFLAPHYSATPLDEYDLDEINECWIKYSWSSNYVSIDVHHKYWADVQINCFIDMLIALGKRYSLVHAVSIVDERE